MASVMLAMPAAVGEERMASVAAIFRRNSPRDDGTIDRKDLRLVLESLRCKHLGDAELEALLPMQASGVPDSIHIEPWLRWLFESGSGNMPSGGSAKCNGTRDKMGSAVSTTLEQPQVLLSEAPMAPGIQSTHGTERVLLRPSTCCTLEAPVATVQVRTASGDLAVEFEVPAVVNVISMKEVVAKATGLAMSKQRILMGQKELAGIWRPQSEHDVIMLTLVEVNDLESVRAALDMLTADNIRELEVLRKPPNCVMITMAALMTALHRPPTWAEAKAFLGDVGHMKDKLKRIDHHSLSSEQLGKLRRLCAMPEFRPESVSGVSRAAGILCLWIRTVVAYADARGF